MCYHYPIKNLFVWLEKSQNGGNLSTKGFHWIFGKIIFFENCQHEFHFCWCEIDNVTFASTFFCRRGMMGVNKTGF